MLWHKMGLKKLLMEDNDLLENVDLLSESGVFYSDRGISYGWLSEMLVLFVYNGTPNAAQKRGRWTPSGNTKDVNIPTPSGTNEVKTKYHAGMPFEFSGNEGVWERCIGSGEIAKAELKRALGKGKLSEHIFGCWNVEYTSPQVQYWKAKDIKDATLTDFISNWKVGRNTAYLKIKDEPHETTWVDTAQFVEWLENHMDGRFKVPIAWEPKKESPVGFSSGSGGGSAREEARGNPRKKGYTRDGMKIGDPTNLKSWERKHLKSEKKVQKSGAYLEAFKAPNMSYTGLAPLAKIFPDQNVLSALLTCQHIVYQWNTKNKEGREELISKMPEYWIHAIIWWDINFIKVQTALRAWKNPFKLEGTKYFRRVYGPDERNRVPVNHYTFDSAGVMQPNPEVKSWAPPKRIHWLTDDESSEKFVKGPGRKIGP